MGGGGLGATAYLQYIAQYIILFSIVFNTWHVLISISPRSDALTDNIDKSRVLSTYYYGGGGGAV